MVLKLDNESMKIHDQNVSVKKEFIVLLTILFCFSLLSLASTEPIIDKDVEEALNNSKWISVSVVLNSIGNKSENLEFQETMIKNLTEYEFQLDHVSMIGRGFSGNISKEGLEKLRNNSYVLRIHLPIVGGSENNINKTDGSEEKNQSEENLENDNENNFMLDNYKLIIILFIILGTLIIRLIKRKRGRNEFKT